MSLAKLLHVVLQNISRSKKTFIFSSIGIIVGISTFTFFIALSQGIRDKVLNRIFPIDQLEVESIGGVTAGGGPGSGGLLGGQPRVLDDAAVAQLGKVAGVSMVFPKMRARFAAKVETGVLDRRMAGEGFMEGLQPSEQVVEDMRRYEQSCSTEDHDQCRRREVPCLRNRDCPHEGMECVERRCAPRQYWRSFSDKHPEVSCTDAAACGDGRACAWDRWIILKTRTQAQIAPVRQASARARHPALDLDIYFPVAEVGSVNVDDLRNAERERGEVWAVATELTQDARDLLDKHQVDVPVRLFATVEQALAHVAGLATSLTEGTCRGERCHLERREVQIGSWKYFEVYENHRGDCPAGLYCAARNVLSNVGRCESYMPVAMNPLMVDFYNANVVSQLGTRPLPNPCLVLGLKGYFRLGFSFLKDSVAPVWQRIRWAEIIGFTDKAMNLGGTVPLPYVRRFNRTFLGPDSIKHYDSVLLQILRNEAVAQVIEQVQKLSFDLSRSSKFARKAGQMLFIITLAFLLISVIIIVISALNISHTFLMVVFERQREIGVMRAIGASRWDIRKIILTESLFIGLVAGIVGNALSYGVSRLVNLAGQGLRDRFPVIPDDFFTYSWVLIGGSIGFALVFCLLGAWVPANRAAKLDPAIVLSSA